VPAWRRGVEAIKASRPYSAWQRYTGANGNLLSAGVAYYAFFSIFPAVALGFAIFGFVLQGRPDLLDAIAEGMNTILPGMIKTADNPTGLISIEAPSSLTLTITGVISFFTLLYAGLGWVSALRTGIRGVFGLDKTDDNFALAKGRDLVVLATLGLAIAASAILTSTIGGFARSVADWMGFTGNGIVVGVLGTMVAILFDTLIMVLLLRVLSDVPLPWHNVRDGAVLGALALTVLKLLGGFLIERATSNPLLGAVAVPVGLLFWLNLIARVVLLSAAVAANRVDVERLVVHGEVDADAALGPAAGRAPADAPTAGGQPPRVAASANPPLDHERQRPSESEGHRLVTRDAPASRSVDRISVAAGAVVGAAAAAAVGAARRLRRADR
jgi:uncharacterized BrkB/YihY/UPF0761 family membrane protein